MILVSILGDFHSSIFPVLNELKGQIKTHILLYNKDRYEQEKAFRYLDGIDIFKTRHGLDFHSANYKIDEDSQHSIEGLLEIFKHHTDDLSELYINVTDGLASVNTLLSLKLIPMGVKMISYDRFDNHGSIVAQEGLTKFTVGHSLSIKDHFALRNMQTEIDTDKTLIQKHQERILRLFREDFKAFNDMRKRSYTEICQLVANPIANELCSLVEAFEPVNPQQFIQGALYELYVAALLMETDIDDIEVGVKIYDKEENLNEFDVLFMKDNHLHMIECKMTHAELNELVYKYAALQDLLDNDGKMALLTKNQDYTLNSIVQQRHHALRRAKGNNILVRGSAYGNEEKFYEDMEHFFHLKIVTK
jgi:hypothetical protein